MRTLTILCLLGLTLAGRKRKNSGYDRTVIDIDLIIEAASHEFSNRDKTEPFLRLTNGLPNHKEYTGNQPERDFKEVTEDLTANYMEGGRFFYFPDAEGKLHRVDSQEPVDEELILAYSNSDNSYLLYTRSNQHTPQFLVPGDVDSVRKSFFDPDKETVFYSHGWGGDGYTPNGQMITEAFLQNKDVNVILLDWSQMAKQPYPTAKSAVPKVGRMFGEFVVWLTSLGLSYENIHLVGFSLGGHVVGNAGRATQGKVRRITALDPAGPLWWFDKDRIVKTDGQYVEVIHTTVIFGYIGACGHADFYPNGGILMPGCLTDICSHNRAVQYMASTVKLNQLNANECKSTLEMLLDICHGSLYPMGNSDLRKSRSGMFRINTNPEYPY